MRWTTKARCLFSLSLADSRDQADGVAEPGIGTAGSPAGLSRTTTASSSYSTDSSGGKPGRRRSLWTENRSLWAENRSGWAGRGPAFAERFFIWRVVDLASAGCRIDRLRAGPTINT